MPESGVESRQSRTAGRGRGGKQKLHNAVSKDMKVIIPGALVPIPLSMYGAGALYLPWVHLATVASGVSVMGSSSSGREQASPQMEQANTTYSNIIF